ncbi:MAG: MarR family transcriptional regulator [Coriobacteriales bacterium]
MVHHGERAPHDFDMPADAFPGVDADAFEAFRALKRLTVAYRHLMMKLFAERGTHPGQGACLFVLEKHPGLSQRELAEYLHVSAPAVTSMLQKMEKAGLVERTTDPADQRLTRLSITETGRDVLAGLHDVFGRQITVMFEGFDRDRILEFSSLLEQMTDNIVRSLRAGKTTTGEA